jgi:hypothetical protein
MKVIIARFNEKIEWIKQLTNVECVVYNKGKDKLDGYNSINLKNVGREGHTYYKYICDNYENLDNYIIFLQGNPFDHSPNIIKNINLISNNVNFNDDFLFLSEHILNTNLNNCPYHFGLPLRNVYNKIFGNDNNDIDIDIMFGAGAQFIVSKKAILKRPINFYQNIVKLLEYDINPIEGFVIERFHKLIFQN